MTSTTSTATIQQLWSIFATFGLPEVLVSDNGPNFKSAEFELFLRRNGIRHKTSPPYHPATNGLAERAVQTVKNGLKMTHGSLQDRLSWFLFTYRNMPQSTTGVSPAELLLGRRLRSPLDLLKPDLHKRVEKDQEHQIEGHDKHASVRSFAPCDVVYGKNFGPSSMEQSWLAGTIAAHRITVLPGEAN